MELFQKILTIVTILIADIVINRTSTSHVDTSANQWQPVLKTKNTTRDWKITTNVQTVSPVSSGKEDMLATASVRRDSTTSSKYHRASIDPIIHDADHVSPNLLHHQPYYDMAPAPPHIGARYESLPDADGYYHHAPYAPPVPSRPPLYGPPYVPPSFPDDSIRIELAFEKLVIRCVVQEPLEHIVWTRYACPNDYFYGNGQPAADGSVVHNTDLYEVHIVGDKGEIASELLLKTPLDPSTTGLYICEAWPHYQKPTDGYGHYQPPMFPSLTDAFIIGGGELIDQCYANHKAPFMHKPFAFKKRYDTEEADSLLHKIAQTKSTKINPLSIDPTRKPRNLTSITNRQLDTIVVSNKPKEIHQNQRQLSLSDKEQRYNFIFGNKTSMLNITAKDAFNNFNLLKLSDNNLLNNISRITDYSQNINHDKTNDSSQHNNNYKFKINRVKFTDHQLNIQENNNTNQILNWAFVSNLKSSNTTVQ